MTWRLGLVLALVIAARASGAQTLDRGPHGVGVRELFLRDPSRPTLPLRDGEAARDVRGRQMHIVLWYPAARSTGRALTRRDYVHMTARALDFSPMTAARRDSAVTAFVARAAGLGGDTSELRRHLPTMLTKPVAGRLDARAVAGRHPLVLFPEWQPPAVNNILAEHLASHGYVVASVATHGTYDSPIEYWSPRGFETMVADLRFVIAALDTVRFVDTKQIGTLGVGISASAGLGLAMRNPLVSAIVSLKGGITTEGEMNLLMRTPYFDIGSVRAPMLAITAPHPSVDAARLDLYKYSTRHLVHFPKMGEFWCLDYGLLERESPRIIGTPPGDVATGYTVAAQVVRRFFDAYLRKRDSARTWLGVASPDSLRAPSDLFTNTVKPGLPAPPTIAELKTRLREGGTRALARLIAQRAPRDAQSIPSEYFVELANTVASDARTRFDLTRMRAMMYPESSRANYAFGVTALASGDTIVARVHLSSALQSLSTDRDPLLDPITRQRIERQAGATLDAIGRQVSSRPISLSSERSERRTPVRCVHCCPTPGTSP